jgi:hypothetical protein
MLPFQGLQTRSEWRIKERDMERKRNKWGFVVVGAVAVLALGVIAVASAAGNQSASPSPSASAQAGQTGAPDSDGDGPHDEGAGGFGRIHGGGPGDIPEALAKLSGKDVGTIMTARADGKSFAEIARANGVGTDELLAETTRIETAELDAAVKAGEMTAAERTQALSGLQARLKEELNETRALPGDGGHGFGRDGDGPDGSTGTGMSSGAAGTGFYGGSASGATQTY